MTSSGKHQLKVIVYDRDGSSCTKESELYYIDKTAPSCGSVTGASTSWTKNDRTITVVCQDNDSGCLKPSYSNTFTSSSKTGTISISDNVGHTTDCPVNVYVDKDKPYVYKDSLFYKDYTGATWCPDRPTEKFPRVVVLYIHDSLSGLTTVTFSWPLGSYKMGNLNKRQTYVNTADSNNIAGASMCGWTGTYNWSACDRAGNCGSGGV